MSISFNKEQTLFCAACAEKSFQIWKGWCSAGTENWDEQAKGKTALPDLPVMTSGNCLICGSAQSLSAEHIYYQNIHGQYNTGLPDYFVLKISKAAVFKDNLCSKFGSPYRDEGMGRISLDKLLSHVQEHYPYDREGI